MKEDPVSDEHMQQVRLEPLIPHNGTITLVESDPKWPVLFDREAVRVRGALGPAVVQLEHVGSTSVPGLVAKPIIDMLRSTCRGSTLRTSARSPLRWMPDSWWGNRSESIDSRSYGDRDRRARGPGSS